MVFETIYMGDSKKVESLELLRQTRPGIVSNLGPLDDGLVVYHISP